jgi:hypothetical protein
VKVGLLFTKFSKNPGPNFIFVEKISISKNKCEVLFEKTAHSEVFLELSQFLISQFNLQFSPKNTFSTLLIEAFLYERYLIFHIFWLFILNTEHFTEPLKVLKI